MWFERTNPLSIVKYMRITSGNAVTVTRSSRSKFDIEVKLPPPLMKRASTGGLVPPKRTRKKATGFQQYLPDLPSAAADNDGVRLVTVRGGKSRSGRFGVRRSTILVQQVSETVTPPSDLPSDPPSDHTQISLEDPNAPDSAEWHDMLEDNVIHVVKRQRKQRNDSVSRLFVSPQSQSTNVS